MVLSACIILLSYDESNNLKILTVSRKNDENNIGIPGGKMDSIDKSLAHAASRELLEETGYQVEPETLKQVFVADGDTGEDEITTCQCTTFITDKYKQIELPKEKGIVSWQPPERLIQANCSFAAYNKRLLMELKLI